MHLVSDTKSIIKTTPVIRQSQGCSAIHQITNHRRVRRRRLVDEIDRQIILILYESRIDFEAKSLGELIHLSRSAILRRLHRLVKLLLVEEHAVATPQTGLKPLYLFRISHQVNQATLCALDALFKSEPKSANPQGEFPSLLETELDPINEQTMKLNYLRSCLAQLNSTGRGVLEVIASNSGITSPEIELILKISKSTLHPYLAQLLKWRLVERRPSTNSSISKKLYAYNLATEVTIEMIETALNTLVANFEAKDVNFFSENNGHSPNSAIENRFLNGFQEHSSNSNSNLNEDLSREVPIETLDQSQNHDQPDNQNNSLISMSERSRETPQLSAMFEEMKQLLAIYKQMSELKSRANLIEEKFLMEGGEAAVEIIEHLRGK